MTGAGVRQIGLGRIHDADERGYDQIGVLQAQCSIGGFEDAVRRDLNLRGDADRLAHLGHHDRRRQALSEHVADRDHDPAIRQRKGVIPVAADLHVADARIVDGGETERPDALRNRAERGALEGRCDVMFALVSAQEPFRLIDRVLQAFVEPLQFDRRPQAERARQHRQQQERRPDRCGRRQRLDPPLEPVERMPDHDDRHHVRQPARHDEEREHQERGAEREIAALAHEEQQHERDRKICKRDQRVRDHVKREHGGLPEKTLAVGHEAAVHRR